MGLTTADAIRLVLARRWRRARSAARRGGAGVGGGERSQQDARGGWACARKRGREWWPFGGGLSLSTAKLTAKLGGGGEAFERAPGSTAGGGAPALAQHTGGANRLLDVFLQPRLTDQPEDGARHGVAHQRDCATEERREVLRGTGWVSVVWAVGERQAGERRKRVAGEPSG